MILEDKILLGATIKILERKKYQIFKDNLNLVGIRRMNGVVNTFDDLLLCIQWDGKDFQFTKSKCTTEPGQYWLDNPMEKEGAAILVPGQYLDCWKLGLHQGKYKALVQARRVKVYRDGNRDKVFDEHPETAQDGIFGINIHRASPAGESVQVDKWSAGCQVLAKNTDFDALILSAEATKKEFFTYSLIRESDFYL